VASDALLSQVDSLRRLAESVRLSAGALLGVLEALEPVGSIASAVPPAALEARRLTRASVRALLTAQNTAEQLASGVAARARDRDGQTHACMYTMTRNFMQSASE